GGSTIAGRSKEGAMSKTKSSSKTNGRTQSSRNGSASRGNKAAKRGAKEKVMEWELRLYVAGNTPNSIAAFSNLQQLCEEHMGGRYRIEIIDLFENPQLARGDQIVAVPTLVR